MKYYLVMIPTNVIIHKGQVGNIYEIRDQKVMLDSDLAILYGVETKVLNQAVARNKARFPGDFAFELTQKEFSALRSQFVTSKGGRRYKPYVFTEHGILMLSSVLRSDKAVKVNIQIMRAFVVLRKTLLNYQELNEKLEKLESKYDEQFTIVFAAIKSMLYEDDEKNLRRIGFKTAAD